MNTNLPKQNANNLTLSVGTSRLKSFSTFISVLMDRTLRAERVIAFFL